MKLLIHGLSQQKETILHLMASEGFELHMVDNTDVLTSELDQENSDISGVVLFNPAYTLLNRITDKKKLIVVFFDEWYEDIKLLMESNSADFCIKGLPDNDKFKKIRNAVNGYLNPVTDETQEHSKLALEEKDLFHRFIEKVPLGLLFFGKDGRLQAFNNEASRILGKNDVQLKKNMVFSDFEESYKKLYGILYSFFDGSASSLSYGERFNIDTRSTIAELNVFPLKKEKRLDGLLVSLRDNSEEYKENVEVGKWADVYENIYYRLMKAFDLKTIGNEIIDAARRISGCRRLYLTYGTEENFERSIFRGFTRNEITKLKNMPYSMNMKTLLFSEKFSVEKNVFLIPAAQTFQIGDLCFMSEEDDTVYDIVLFPIIDKEDRITGVLRIDYPEHEQPSPVIIKVIKSIVNNTAIALENARLHQSVFDREKFLTKIYDNSLENFIVLDSSYRILSFNKAGESITGYKREDVIGRKLTVLFDYEVLEEIREILEKKSSFVVEKTLLRQDGSKVEVMMTASSFIENKKNRVLLMLSDLSKLRNLQEQLIEMEKISAISLAAVTANDKINTPLTIILAHLGILKYKGLDRITEKDLNESVRVIEEQVDKIAKIVKKLRGVSTLKTRYYADRDTLMLDIDSVDLEDSFEF